MSAKAYSTAVQGLWNPFGGALNAKRRSTKNATLAKTVYPKMNLHLLDTDTVKSTDSNGFESLLEFLDATIEGKIVQDARGGVDCDQIMDCTSPVEPAGSGSGSAGSWSV